MLSIFRIGGEKALSTALSDWYKRPDKDHIKWALKHPTDVIENDHLALQEQNLWALSADIEFTPTIFIDGRKLPRNYSISELKHFI